MSVRLTQVLSSGLSLPDGPVAVLRPVPDHDLSALPQAQVAIEQPFKPWHDHFRAIGYAVTPEDSSPAASAVVFLPRARDAARALLRTAVTRVGTGPVLVDGAKTDGVESALKEVRARVEVQGTVSKAHGKLFWFDAQPDLFADWATTPRTPAEGFTTMPGVFSADAVDDGSAALADAVKGAKLGRHVVDLGAGWGYLSAHLLQDDHIETLDLVEADHVALDCARRNVTDPRARFHWADATVWAAEAKVDSVVMNPPFHTARAGDPSIGQAFVVAASRILRPGGQLILVANRHLPYEETLATRFGDVTEIGGDNRFKIIRAVRPVPATGTAGHNRHTPRTGAERRRGKGRATG
ncbi:class I SAM-dependent methyltransferase [Chachezhania sediminis]|uniref:class I SAM-dependent methyltransferase n=1 Tax=Chachezhania sediminis TaxID=2599291 RepID=UPI00131D672E|nr:class I SAM-dependent methyltransferase [Chachezhania sediminis]